MNKPPIKVSIVQDDARTREKLMAVLGSAKSLQCLRACSNGEEALREIPREVPDVVLMDINLPGINGVECVRQLKKIAPEIQVMMLTVYEDTENIFDALAAGASGYMLKRTSTRELLEAIQ